MPIETHAEIKLPPDARPEDLVRILNHAAVLKERRDISNAVASLIQGSNTVSVNESVLREIGTLVGLTHEELRVAAAALYPSVEEKKEAVEKYEVLPTPVREAREIMAALKGILSENITDREFLVTGRSGFGVYIAIYIWQPHPKPTSIWQSLKQRIRRAPVGSPKNTSLDECPLVCSVTTRTCKIRDPALLPLVGDLFKSRNFAIVRDYSLSE